MNDITSLVAGLSEGYCMNQVLLMCALFVIGSFFLKACGMAGYDGYVYAFPTGLSLFSVSGYLMLCLGIPFNTDSVSVVLSVSFIISAIISYRKEREKQSKDKAAGKGSRKRLADTGIAFVAFAVTAIILCLNIFHVAVDSDSFHYFSVYPHALVSEGRYLYNFDAFLTDCSPIGSIVYTLPYLFDFSETFGIMYMTDLCMLLAFGGLIYDLLKGKRGKKEALVSSVGGTLFLATSSAYLTTAKWVMAGVYFMSFYFFTAALGYKMSFYDKGERPYPVLALFAVMTAMMRQEGLVLVLVLILALSALTGYTGKELLLTLVAPVAVAAALYYIRIFAFIGVDPLYAFLTRGKAVVMLAAAALVGIYIAFIRGRRFKRILGNFFIVLPAAVLLLNLAILVLRHERYLTNLYMFYYNLRTRAGWGFFGYLAFLGFVIIVIKAVVKKEKELSFFDSLCISYVFAVLIVSYGRGDALREGIGDSGNRVMLTAVPLIVLAFALRLLDWRETDEKA